MRQPDIQDDETGFYGSYAEYAVEFIRRIACDMPNSKQSGNIDTHQFVPDAEVLRQINVSFASRAEVKYWRCEELDEECDTHDGHLEWRLIKPLPVAHPS